MDNDKKSPQEERPALLQQVQAIRVRGGLNFISRQKIRDAGGHVIQDREDELVVGFNPDHFSRLTGIPVI